ncbi:hypothetical protein JOF53_007944 [Crossiella equi]|uniref:Aspartate kinase n=1 Tax=Crossiella equi TaxID=130796 RepID=A0ABS5AS78_9PSEU|nr:hypothetical protein [Crossiella equi]MBP2479072.1 hypothetical protein [Crossiella equi]
MERALVHGVRTSAHLFALEVTGAHPLADLVRALPGLDSLAVDGPSVTLVVPRDSLPLALTRLRSSGQVHLAGPLTEVAVLGAGLRSDPAMVSLFCEAVARAGAPLRFLGLEGAVLSVRCPDHLAVAVTRAVCEVFEVQASDRAMNNAVSPSDSVPV